MAGTRPQRAEVAQDRVLRAFAPVSDAFERFSVDHGRTSPAGLRWSSLSMFMPGAVAAVARRRRRSRSSGTTRMMASMTAFELGGAVLVRFPFTDQSATKQRPAVVISSEAYHRSRPDVVIMAITSQARPRPVIGAAPTPPRTRRLTIRSGGETHPATRGCRPGSSGR